MRSALAPLLIGCSLWAAIGLWAGTRINVFQIRGIDRVPQAASVAVIFPDGTTQLAKLGPGLVLANDPAGILTLAASTPFLRFVTGEAPAGAIDGANLIYTLGQTPTPASSLELSRNGLLLAQGADYTLTAATITFAAGNAPQPGDTLQVSYRY